MNRRKFMTAVAAGVATAIAGPEKLFVFGEDTIEIITGIDLAKAGGDISAVVIRSKGAGAIWNMSANFFHNPDLNRKLREAIAGAIND